MLLTLSTIHSDAIAQARAETRLKQFLTTVADSYSNHCKNCIKQEARGAETLLAPQKCSTIYIKNTKYTTYLIELIQNLATKNVELL